MKILITGASGFTGKHFYNLATQAGHDPISLAANITEPQAVASEIHALGHIDAVVHLAAISFVGHANDAEFYSVNTVGTSNLLAALSKLPSENQPKKVLVASSANVYGNCDHSPIAEAQVPAPTNHYATSKLAMEWVAKTFLDRLPIVIARPFNYTGPGQPASFLIPKLITHFSERRPHIELGNIHVEREFNDVRMVCDAYLRLLAQGIPGETYNICSGTPHTIQSVMECLENLTHHKVEVLINPAFVRTNEVHRLCGDPSHLERCIGPLKEFKLASTLSSMLNAVD